MLMSEFVGLPYHNIDPELFRWGWLVIRWYSLAYIAGIFIGWWYLVKLSTKPGAPMNKHQADDFILWVTFGIILGGRLGYVLFYRPDFYLENPSAILSLWDGGMAFHGGLLGVMVAAILFTRRNKIDLYSFSDRMACVAPIGLFFGRIANFINGELWGAPSTLPWAMYFPGAGDEPRHPSQIYEMLLEGVVLFLILNYLLLKTRAARMPGMVAGSFFTLYALFRYLVEFVREPDAHLGRFGDVISMGQILSLPMMAFGLYLIFRAIKRDKEVQSS